MQVKLTTEVPIYQRKRRMSPGDIDVCRENVSEEDVWGLPGTQQSDSSGQVSHAIGGGDIRQAARGGGVQTLDLRQGFNQIPIKEEDRKKTAFHGPDGLYEWKFMPFGMKNAPALFQRVMDSVLRNVPAAACYIDDVVVFSASAEQHVKDVSDTLAAIRDAGLTCHPKKCSFGNSSVKYLGFEVQGGQLSIQQAKVEVLDRVSAPKDRSTLRVVLGFLNYYRKFVPNFSRTAAVLNKLLREEQAWQWGEAEQGAFKALLKAVKTGTVLTLPNKEDPFVLYTEWSSAGMGGILCQEREG
ncbi:unnamed protein product [Closterium sp. Yama58-4]|nr:unnamed protein product [Closterium sp. Yama58-4]